MTPAGAAHGAPETLLRPPGIPRVQRARDL